MPSNNFLPISTGGSSALKQVVNDGFTINGVLQPIPTETPDAAHQLAQSANGFEWESNSTTPGDWTGFVFNPIGGINFIGDPRRSGNGPAFTSNVWYFQGSPSRQINTITGDGALILINCNPYGSGSNLSVAYVGKTNQGSLLSVNANAENIYLHDQFAGSFLITPENGAALNNPGVVSVLGNANHPVDIAQTFNPTGTTANYPYMFCDPRTNPYKTYFPKFVDQKIDPTTVGWISALVIDHTTGIISVPGLLKLGTLSSQINNADGTINVGAFSNTISATLNAGATDVSFHTIALNSPFRSIAVGPISIDLQGSGIGFNWDSGAAELGCGYQGNKIWSVGSTTGPFNCQVDIATNVVGKGLRVKEGANGKQGVAVLVAGTVTVANTSITANSRIFLSRSTIGGTVGHLSTTQNVGVSFTINSSLGTDTSTINWQIFEPG